MCCCARRAYRSNVIVVLLEERVETQLDRPTITVMATGASGEGKLGGPLRRSR